MFLTELAGIIILMNLLLVNTEIIDYPSFIAGVIFSIIGLSILIWNRSILTKYMKVNLDRTEYRIGIIIMGLLVSLFGLAHVINSIIKIFIK